MSSGLMAFLDMSSAINCGKWNWLCECMKKHEKGQAAAIASLLELINFMESSGFDNVEKTKFIIAICNQCKGMTPTPKPPDPGKIEPIPPPRVVNCAADLKAFACDSKSKVAYQIVLTVWQGVLLSKVLDGLPMSKKAGEFIVKAMSTLLAACALDGNLPDSVVKAQCMISSYQKYVVDTVPEPFKSAIKRAQDAATPAGLREWAAACCVKTLPPVETLDDLVRLATDMEPELDAYRDQMGIVV